MNSASDYLTGDDMIAHLLGGIDGASEGATYAVSDVSHEALVARNREVFASVAGRGALIDANAFFGYDARDLERAGLIVVSYASRHLTYAITDAGAEVAMSVSDGRPA